MCKKDISLILTRVLIEGLVRCILVIDSWALKLVLSGPGCRLRFLIVGVRMCEVDRGGGKL